MYYVYRYRKNFDIFYIGITTNLETRLAQHKKKDWFTHDLKYEFIELPNRKVSKIYESYLIWRDKPRHNVAEMNCLDLSVLGFDINEDWTPFTTKNVCPTALAKMASSFNINSLLGCKILYTLLANTKLLSDDNLEIVLGTNYFTDLLGKNISPHIKEATTNINNNINGLTYNEIQVFDAINYSQGIMTVKLNLELKPYIRNIKTQYNLHYLKNVLNLNSSYSLRVYNILRSDLYKGVVEYDLEQFKTMVNCNYDKFNNIKTKVLEVSKKEINLKTDLEVDYEFVKEGRRVVALRFYIKEQKNLEQQLYDNY